MKVELFLSWWLPSKTIAVAHSCRHERLGQLHSGLSASIASFESFIGMQVATHPCDLGGWVTLYPYYLKLRIRLRVREKLGGPRVVRHRGLREEVRPPPASRVGPLDLLESRCMLRVGLKSHGANAGRIITKGGVYFEDSKFTLT